MGWVPTERLRGLRSGGRVDDFEFADDGFLARALPDDGQTVGQVARSGPDRHEQFAAGRAVAVVPAIASEFDRSRVTDDGRRVGVDAKRRRLKLSVGLNVFHIRSAYGKGRSESFRNSSKKMPVLFRVETNAVGLRWENVNAGRWTAKNAKFLWQRTRANGTYPDWLDQQKWNSVPKL